MKKIDINEEKPITKYSRQGDVYLYLVEDESRLPDNLEWEEVKEFTLAHGESTGHRHRLVAELPGSAVWVARGFDGKTYVRTTRGVRGYHEQHDEHGYDLPEGFHQQGQEIEYDYLSKKNRRSMD